MNLQEHFVPAPANTFSDGRQRSSGAGNEVEVVDSLVDCQGNRFLDFGSRGIMQASRTKAKNADLLSTARKRAVLH